MLPQIDTILYHFVDGGRGEKIYRYVCISFVKQNGELGKRWNIARRRAA
ncbi:MAG: hypothetical protein JRJ57_07495 [Deltaproteobacteria bacterium]|nr:hypothetical protein [Deltaproteobacteria bacterium]